MPERPVVIRQHGVGAFTQQGVPERILCFAGESALLAPEDQLSIRELLEPLLDPGGAWAGAEELRYGARPEHLTEHGRGAQRAARVLVECAEPGLHHGHDGPGEVIALAFRGGADRGVGFARHALGRCRRGPPAGGRIPCASAVGRGAGAGRPYATRCPRCVGRSRQCLRASDAKKRRYRARSAGSAIAVSLRAGSEPPTMSIRRPGWHLGCSHDLPPERSR